jgi:hypothetical protein
VDWALSQAPGLQRKIVHLAARGSTRTGRVAGAAGPQARLGAGEDVVPANRAATKLSLPRARDPLSGKILRPQASSFFAADVPHPSPPLSEPGGVTHPCRASRRTPATGC